MEITLCSKAFEFMINSITGSWFQKLLLVHFFHVHFRRLSTALVRSHFFTIRFLQSGRLELIMALALPFI